MKRILSLFLFISLVSFTKAQSPCDDLNFISIGYSPFTDTVVVVAVENNSTTEIFDYPGFILINTNGDTVAKEIVNYFGIGAQSVHSLQVRPVVQDPLENFEGVLQLYSGFYSDFECEWQLNETLCTENECDSIILAFENYGGALVLGDFAWSLFDSTETVLESGTFTMEAQGQHWEKRLCLPKGMYSYTLAALGQPTGGGPTLTVSTSPWFLAPSIQQPFDWFNETATALEFPFYTHCIQEETPNGIDDIQNTLELRILTTGGQTIVQHTQNIDFVQIFALDGRMVASLKPNHTEFILPSNLNKGLYLVSLETELGLKTLKVIL